MHGNRIHRLDAPVGNLRVDYAATIVGRTDTAPVTEYDLSMYLRPSRYAEADKFYGFAATEFGNYIDSTSFHDMSLVEGEKSKSSRGVSGFGAAALGLSAPSLCPFSWPRKVAASLRWMVACCCRRQARIVPDVDLDLGGMCPRGVLVGERFSTSKVEARPPRPDRGSVRR